MTRPIEIEFPLLQRRQPYRSQVGDGFLKREVDPFVGIAIGRARRQHDRFRFGDRGTGDDRFHSDTRMFVLDAVRQKCQRRIESVVPPPDDSGCECPDARITRPQYTPKQFGTDHFDRRERCQAFHQKLLVMIESWVDFLGPRIERLGDFRRVS